MTGTAFRLAGWGARRLVPTVAEVVRHAGWVVRLGAAGGALALAACARPVPRLAVSSIGAPVPIAGYFSGVATIGADVVTLEIDSARVVVAGVDGGRVEGLTAPGAVELTDVTVRAVLAADSAGQAIPLGVSGVVEVAERLRAGEVRELRRTEFALPVPVDVRLADVWVIFQLRALALVDGATPREVLSYACSATNLTGRPASAKRRAERLRASYTDACRM